MANSIQKRKVRDIEESFYYLNPLEKIPKEYWEEEVWLQVPVNVGAKLRVNAHKHLRDQLNYRFLVHQLGLTDSIQELTQRELWYYIEILLERDDMVMDSVYETLFLIEIERYCSRITNVSGYTYWGYVLDTLKVKSKGRAMIYEDVNRAIALDKDTLINYTETPFFLLICEKEGTLTGVLEELIKRDYKKEHFYCINAGGMATTNLIRLIRKYRGLKNFHIFVLHDFDMKGIQIFLDIMKHFTCESIGVNSDFLEYSGYEFDKLCEGYKNKKGKKLDCVDNKTEVGTRTVLDGLDIDIVKKEKYREWVDTVVWSRIELNSITAHNVERDPTASKVKDFVDYFEHITEESKFNLTRVKAFPKREYSRFTEKVIWSIKSSILFNHNREPEFIKELLSKNMELIEGESREFIKEVDEFKTSWRQSFLNIRNKLDKLKEDEIENKEEKIYAFNENNPNIFNVEWWQILEELMGDSIDKMDNEVIKLRKYISLKNLREYLKHKRELESHKGYTTKVEFKINQQKVKLKRYVKDNELTGRVRRNKLYKVMDRQLKRTDEYKTAKKETNKLVEDLNEEKEEEKDRRAEIVEALRKRMEKTIDRYESKLDALINEKHE
ncbi:hypothetical protein LCGC14_1084270 [marine sediment metagenome]|uniref:Uncharacterized protein n=1 Tax=marine sediment metagenome TaxID=412755 RepID=A0A0F9QKA8_9ZZZZ